MNQTLPPPGQLPPPDPPQRPTSAYEKLRSELVAGGATAETDTVSARDGLVGILVLVGLLVWLGTINIWMLVLVIGLIISVFLHEVGHFATARWAGMKCTQFFLGFGPKLWSFRRGEVEYGLRAIPLGAFVRIIGMNNLDEVPPADEGRTYRSKSYPKRMIVITAGSAMHFLIAIGLLFGIYSTAGRLEDTGRVRVEAVTPDSPAAQVGLRPGDVILDVEGRPVSSVDALVAGITALEPGDTLTFTYERDGEARTAEAVLVAHPDVPHAEVAYLGVGTDTYAYVDQGVGEALVHTVGDLARGTALSVEGIVKVLNPVNQWEHLTGQRDDLETRPTTLVGVTRVAGDVGNLDGLKGVLALLAGINVFVGLFNLVPLLPFDGGHAAIATYERLRSRRGRRYRADVSKMMPVVVGVLSLLAFLLFTGLYLDIAKPL
jgi:membrane-associated protease RseP (regulator of RpoE activity)